MSVGCGFQLAAVRLSSELFSSQRSLNADTSHRGLEDVSEGGSGAAPDGWRALVSHLVGGRNTVLLWLSDYVHPEPGPPLQNHRVPDPKKHNRTLDHQIAKSLSIRIRMLLPDYYMLLHAVTGVSLTGRRPPVSVHPGRRSDCLATIKRSVETPLSVCLMCNDRVCAADVCSL